MAWKKKSKKESPVTDWLRRQREEEYKTLKQASKELEKIWKKNERI